jgi:hypothetical protein
MIVGLLDWIKDLWSFNKKPQTPTKRRARRKNAKEKVAKKLR